LVSLRFFWRPYKEPWQYCKQIAIKFCNFLEQEFNSFKLFIL
jgi:hypothetical protein